MNFPERYQVMAGENNSNRKLIPIIAQLNTYKKIDLDLYTSKIGGFTGRIQLPEKRDKVILGVANKLKVCYKHACQEVLMDRGLPKKMGIN